MVEGRFKLVRVRNREEEVEDGERGREEGEDGGKERGKNRVYCSDVTRGRSQSSVMAASY